MASGFQNMGKIPELRRRIFYIDRAPRDSPQSAWW